MGRVYGKSLPQLQRLIGDGGDDLASAVEGTWWGGWGGFFVEQIKKNIGFPVQMLEH